MNSKNQQIYQQTNTRFSQKYSKHSEAWQPLINTIPKPAILSSISGFPNLSMKQQAFLLSSVFVAGFALLPAKTFASEYQIPNVVQQIPSGSMADLRTTGAYDSNKQVWNLTFRRKLNTGDALHDILFEAGKTYAFQIAAIDNATGLMTSEAAPHISQSTTVFNMTIPAVAGNLTFSAVPEKLKSISGKLLATNEIEISLSWVDQTKNDSVGSWQYDEASATWQQETQQSDQLAIIWDMQNDNFVSSGNCDQMCHTTLSPAAGTKIDAWHWVAATSGPIGHAVDEYWENGMNPDPGRPAFVDNELVNGRPRYQVEGHANRENVKRLFLFPDGVNEAVKPATFPSEDWENGDVLPASVIRPPRGGIADVVTSSSHNGKQWTVTFRRKLNTGGDSGHDIVFEKGKDYSFLYTYHNNADHDYGQGLAHIATNPNTPFTMTIPTTPGPLLFPVIPNRLTGISGKLLDSDEIEITVSWPDSSRNDNKRQWRYDATNAATPWTRAAAYSVGTAPNIVYATAAQQAERTFSSDRFTLLWDMAGDRFQTTGNCTEMCHSGEVAMRTKAGVLDAWTWTGSSRASGYASDQYWDDNGGTGIGDNKSDGGSQTASITNTGFNAAGTAVVSADTAAAKLLYTAKAGAGHSSTYLYLDSPQADGWSRGVESFVKAVTKSKVRNTSKEGKHSLDISGSYDDRGNELELPAAPMTISLGNAFDLSIPANSFKKSKADGRYLSYVDKASHISIKFDTKKKTFQVTATRQNLSTLANPANLNMSVGSWTAASMITWK